ncbi:MAG: GDP-mannose 4,6-dehydratase [Selenomonadaceae bacterium]|nr:GDP-mannose 4,6-dehydratase [Selenomonadaceae bacterium]MBP3722789.1 GDP-mannose 4,6-dehydratase [Selenomonadaceae bacterium]
MKKAIITGVTGQDGSYLAELLLSKGYEVTGLIRRASSHNTERIDHIKDDNFHLYEADLSDSLSLTRIIGKIQPNEVYNLAAQSHVGSSFDAPEYTANITGVGTIRLLEALRQTKPDTKFYQASTSELFGGIPGTEPQSEKTPFHPRSPYGAAKLYAYWIVKNYREAYNMFAVNGILFNHESPRRGENFVTRKITLGVANILAKKQDKISLGNLDAKRDWGFAGDYVEGMYLMLQREKPNDYVLATKETHTVRAFATLAFRAAGIDIEFEGEGVKEKGYDKKTGKLLIDVNPEFFRPAEVEILLGDSSFAETTLGWRRKVSFNELVKMMVEEDMKKVKCL